MGLKSIFTGTKGKLRIALAINIGLVIVALVGYLISNSLALLGDAGHVLTDTPSQ